MDLWLYGVSPLPITLTQFTTFYLNVTWPKSKLFGCQNYGKFIIVNFKKLCCNYLPFISPFRAFYHWSRVFWVDMHLSCTSAEIYDFALANWVNVNKIIIFVTTILCSLKALIGFGRCYIPFADGLSCSELKSVCIISMHKLQANSWKYTCLRMMDCLHNVTATCKVLKGLNEVWGQLLEVVLRSEIT